MDARHADFDRFGYLCQVQFLDKEQLQHELKPVWKLFQRFDQPLAIIHGGERFERIEGVAAREPLIPDDPSDPRNRRISILLVD